MGLHAGFYKKAKKLAQLSLFLSGQLIGVNRITAYDATGRLRDVSAGPNPCYETISATVAGRTAVAAAIYKEQASLSSQDGRLQVDDFEKSIQKAELRRPLTASMVTPAAPLLSRLSSSWPIATVIPPDRSPVVPFHLNSKK